jgi:hypothetical protein
MFDIHAELKDLVDALDKAGVEHALCGGLAMSVYGIDRPTTNIDLLISPEDVNAFRKVAIRLGFTVEVQPVSFADGAVMIVKFIRRDQDAGGDLSLKALLVTPDLHRVWGRRECIPWEGRRLCVVSRWGMIELKTLRRTPRDLEDIASLRESE